MQLEHLAVGAGGLVEALGLERGLGLEQQALQGRLLAAQVGGANLHVVGRVPQGRFQLFQAVGGAALGEQALALAQGLVAGAGGQQAGQRQPERKMLHGAILRVLCWFRGS